MSCAGQMLKMKSNGHPPLPFNTSPLPRRNRHILVRLNGSGHLFVNSSVLFGIPIFQRDGRRKRKAPDELSFLVQLQRAAVQFADDPVRDIYARRLQRHREHPVFSIKFRYV